MSDNSSAERFDALAVQVHEWTDAAVALDEGHFPNELLSDLEDLNEELKTFLEEAGDAYRAADLSELFVTPEMAEVIARFPKVRRQLERAWGSPLIEQIQEEGEGFSVEDEEF